MIVDITPSSSLKYSQHCFTLSKFASTTLNFEMVVSENTTLILQPGNHSLMSPVVVRNTDIFVMHSKTKDAIITCNQSGIFKFVNVSTVRIQNLTFSGCGNIYKPMFEFQFIGNAMINQCSIRWSKGSIIRSYQSVLKIVNTVLINTSSSNGTIWFEASAISFEDCTVINNTVHNNGVIHAFNNCILTISQSSFENNSVETSAMIWVQSSSLSLFDSIMMSGNKCFLGVLFIFQSLVQSNGKLSIMANEAILHNVYIARSEIGNGRYSFR